MYSDQLQKEVENELSSALHKKDLGRMRSYIAELDRSITDSKSFRTTLGKIFAEAIVKNLPIEWGIFLISNRANIFFDNELPLRIAIQQNNPNYFELLLDNKSKKAFTKSFRYDYYYINNPIFMKATFNEETVISSSNEEVIKIIFEKQQIINFNESISQTLIRLASLNEIELFKKYLNKAFSIETVKSYLEKSSFKDNIISNCISDKNLPIFQYFMSLSKDSTKTFAYNIILHKISSANRDNLSIHKYENSLELFKHLISISSQEEINEAAIKFIRDIELKYLNLLFEAGADIHYKDDAMLIAATRYSKIRFPTIKFLIEKGANVNAQNGEALNNIMRNNDREGLKLLLETGANI